MAFGSAGAVAACGGAAAALAAALVLFSLLPLLASVCALVAWLEPSKSGTESNFASNILVLSPTWKCCSRLSAAFHLLFAKAVQEPGCVHYEVVDDNKALLDWYRSAVPQSCNAPVGSSLMSTKSART